MASAVGLAIGGFDVVESNGDMSPEGDISSTSDSPPSPYETGLGLLSSSSDSSGSMTFF